MPHVLAIHDPELIFFWKPIFGIGIGKAHNLTYLSIRNMLTLNQGRTVRSSTGFKEVFVAISATDGMIFERQVSGLMPA
jgi:hypothetical protein